MDCENRKHWDGHNFELNACIFIDLNSRGVSGLFQCFLLMHSLFKSKILALVRLRKKYCKLKCKNLHLTFV